MDYVTDYEHVGLVQRGHYLIECNLLSSWCSCCSLDIKWQSLPH